MNEFELNIVTDCNISVVNFFVVTLNVVKNIYELYRKPNDELSYINVNSCGSPLAFRNLINNIIEMISGFDLQKMYLLG